MYVSSSNTKSGNPTRGEQFASVVSLWAHGGNIFYIVHRHDCAYKHAPFFRSAHVCKHVHTHTHATNTWGKHFNSTHLTRQNQNPVSPVRSIRRGPGPLAVEFKFRINYPSTVYIFILYKCVRACVRCYRLGRINDREMATTAAAAHSSH